MWNKLQKIIVAWWVVAIFLISGLSLRAQDGADISLKWEDVPGALGYILEVRDSNQKVILSKKLDENYFELKDLSPGIYDHRVGIVNKFGKVEGYTEWVPIEIVRAKVPIINEKKVFSAGKEEDTTNIGIRGKDFMEGMKVYLKKDGETIQAHKVTLSEDGGYASADFRIKEIPDIGYYDLVLENPKKKIAVSHRNFILGRDKEQAEKIANRQARINNNELPPDYYDTPYWSTMWRSAIFPGWGQKYIDERNWKLYVYPLVLFGTAGAYASAYRDFLSARKTYYENVQLGFLITNQMDSELIFLLNNQSSTANYNAAKSRLNHIQAGAGAIGIFAIYNLVDAYLSVRRNVVTTEPSSIPIDGDWRLRANTLFRASDPGAPFRGEAFNGLELYYRF